MLINFNTISAELSEEDHTSIINSIKAVEGMLPFAITMPTEDRMSLPRVGMKAAEFIGKAHEYALKNPEMVPQFLDMDEFSRDAVLANQLQVMVNHMVPLLDKIVDTYSLVNAEAYNEALVFYQHVKTAARGNVPGASAVAKELAKSFKRPKSKKPKDSGTDGGSDGAAGDPVTVPVDQDNPNTGEASESLAA
jgi:hypothetical protein